MLERKTEETEVRGFICNLGEVKSIIHHNKSSENPMSLIVKSMESLLVNAIVQKSYLS